MRGNPSREGLPRTRVLVHAGACTLANIMFAIGTCFSSGSNMGNTTSDTKTRSIKPREIAIKGRRVCAEHNVPSLRRDARWPIKRFEFA